MATEKKDIEDVPQQPEYVHDDVFGEISEHGPNFRNVYTSSSH